MARLISEQTNTIAGMTTATLKIKGLSIKHPWFKKLNEAFEKGKKVNFQKSKFYVRRIDTSIEIGGVSFVNIDLIGHGKVYGSTIKYLNSKGLTFRLDVNYNPIDISSCSYVKYDYEKVEEVLPQLRVGLDTRDTLPEPNVEFETKIFETKGQYCGECNDIHDFTQTLYSQRTPTKRKAQTLHRKWKTLLKTRGLKRTLNLLMEKEKVNAQSNQTHTQATRD
jgi:hypothetical protein